MNQNINNLVFIHNYRIFPKNKFNGIKCCLKIPCECKKNLFDHTYRLAVKVRIDGTPENPVNFEEKNHSKLVNHYTKSNHSVKGPEASILFF